MVHLYCVIVALLQKADEVTTVYGIVVNTSTGKKKMATNITIKLEHRSGELARLGEALGQAGINVDGMCAVTSAGAGTIHLLVEDAGGARTALAAAGISVDSEHEVLVVEAIEDQPGALGEIARRVADAGVNLDLAYLATNTRVVLGADDLEKARVAL